MIEPGIMTLLSILTGWLLADLLSGILHWLEDNYGSEDWPILGPLVIAPNRLHHRDPGAFIRTGNFLSRNSTGTATALAIGLLAAFSLGPSLMLAVAVFGGCVANEVHAFAHRPAQAPAWVRALQRIGLLQSFQHHAAHHVTPHDRAYCILTSWLNPVLDRIGIWRRLDAVVTLIKRPH